MAENQSTKLSAQLEVVEIGNRVQEISARMAGFKGALDQHLETVDQDVGNSLAMLAGMAEYMQLELSAIGERLGAVNRRAR